MTPPDAAPAFAERDIRPIVQRPRTGFSGAAIAIGAVLAAIILFVMLDARRRARMAPATVRRVDLALERADLPPLFVPPEPAVSPSPPPPTAEPASSPMPPPQPSVIDRPLPAPAAAEPAPAPSPRNLAAPAWVVDHRVPAAGDPRTTKAPSASGADTQATGRAHAAMLTDQAATVPQGTLIPAILETGLDSSHAGFARALVQRDIRGFDGSTILIPRGSRLIGEYAGNAAQGQKRAFIIWSRLIRPDGVTIALNSPAADPVGGGGIKAHVNSHFFARFSGAILQSVLNLGVNLASRAVKSPVVVALPGALQGTTSTMVQPAQIAPTLKVKPGTSISVFVARDLDFGGAETDR
jgi:type IV secretion system protein VirB10